MEIMDCRHHQLQVAIDGYNSTDIPLVSLSGNAFGNAGYTDDLGIYYFIPLISKLFGIPNAQAVNVFYGTLLLLGATIAIFCFLKTFQHWGARAISIVGTLMLTYAAFRYSDVYIGFFFAVATTLPLFILWNQTSLNLKLLLSIAFSGLIIGYSNFIRSHAGTGAFLFILFWILLNKNLLTKNKTLCSLILVCFSALPYIHFSIMEHNRDLFLKKVNPSYEPISVTHPKWHAIYLGLGYLPNSHGIEWSDRIAFEKAQSISPKVVSCSVEYENILREQFFLILKSDPLFVLKTMAFKFMKLLFRFFQFVNFGLLFFFYVRPSFRMVLPFIIAACFYSLPGILVMPSKAYVLGMTSVATFLGIYLIGLGIEKYIPLVIRESVLPASDSHRI